MLHCGVVCGNRGTSAGAALRRIPRFRAFVCWRLDGVRVDGVQGNALLVSSTVECEEAASGHGEVSGGVLLKDPTVPLENCLYPLFPSTRARIV